MRQFSWKIFWQYLLLIPLFFMTLNISIGHNIFWLHNVDLFFHEAGHTLFLFSGEEFHFLGGTILQLLTPLSFALYFFFTARFYSATIMLWWLGESLTDVGLYMSDARSQLLPLLGGGNHDWFYLFYKWGLLLHDKTIGSVFWWSGIIIMYVAIVVAIIFIFRSQKNKVFHIM